VLDGAVVSFLTPQRHFDHAAEITWMAVHAHHRHRGIGRALITRLCSDLAAEGRRLLVVDRLPLRPGLGTTRRLPGDPRLLPGHALRPHRDLPGLWPSDTAVLLVKPLARAG
jgi:GNAT superfamily N-acetyltransferase